MKLTIRTFVVVAMILGINGTVRANFHLWTINEIYSNHDGSIQFIELTALAGGQQFLNMHQLTSTRNGTTNTFTFPSDLPGDTLNKTMLIGTARFAALNPVAPDYVVPNGFLFSEGGTLNFAESSDVFVHGAIPTDGRHALLRGGGTPINSPRNFAGATGILTLPIAGNFDGDLRADITVFRPSTGNWHVLRSSTGFNMSASATYSWGTSTDTVVKGDCDGDGTADVAIYRPTSGQWLCLESHSLFTTFISVTWGAHGDLPVPADYDGDGLTDPAIFRPSTGNWHVLQSSANYLSFATYSFGTMSDDVLLPGDYDGDGKADPAVFRPSSGTWLLLLSSTNYMSVMTISWGVMSDVPVPGDYDGDGRTDPGVWRDGRFLILRSSTNYTSYLDIFWGATMDVPVPGDYDGDGRVDPAVFRPATGGWHILRSSTNYMTSMSTVWGTSTDTPILAAGR